MMGGAQIVMSEELIDLFDDFKERFEYADISRAIKKQRAMINDLVDKAKLGQQITNMELMATFGIPLSLLDDTRIYKWVVDGLREDKIPYLKEVSANESLTEETKEVQENG